MLVGAVVVNYNTARLTLACVESLLAIMSPHDIVVVDNSSSDEEFALLKAAITGKAHLIALQQNYGFSLANNCGVAHLLRFRPEWILFLNSDTEIKPDAISKALGLSDDGRVGAIGMRLLDASNPDLVQLGAGRFSPLSGKVWFQDRGASRIEAHNTVQCVNFVHGGAALVRASAFLDVGMFPRDIFMYGEDVDLSLRLQHGGWKLLYQPAAEVLHHSGASAGGYMSLFSVYHSTLSMWRVIQRNYPWYVYALYNIQAFFWFLPAFSAYCLLFRRPLLHPLWRSYWHRLRGKLNLPPVGPVVLRENT